MAWSSAAAICSREASAHARARPSASAALPPRTTSAHPPGLSVRRTRAREGGGGGGGAPAPPGAAATERRGVGEPWAEEGQQQPQNAGGHRHPEAPVPAGEEAMIGFE